MAEFVCNLIPDDPDVPYDSDDYSGECLRLERVVRCRDCAHAITSYRDGLPRCAGPLVMEATLVSPDGFCACGEPREVGV